MNLDTQMAKHQKLQSRCLSSNSRQPRIWSLESRIICTLSVSIRCFPRVQQLTFLSPRSPKHRSERPHLHHLRQPDRHLGLHQRHPHQDPPRHAHATPHIPLLSNIRPPPTLIPRLHTHRPGLRWLIRRHASPQGSRRLLDHKPLRRSPSLGRRRPPPQRTPSNE